MANDGLEPFPEAGMGDASEIAGIAVDLLGGGNEEAEEGGLLAPPMPTAPLLPTYAEAAPEVEEEQEPELFSFEPKVDDSFTEWLQEEDEVYVEQEDQSQVEGEEYEDPETSALRARLAAAEKKIAFQEAQKVKQSRKGWEAEALERFNLCDPKTITATSHRGFLREAQEQHNRMRPVAEKIREQVRNEERELAKKQWGTRVQGGPQVPAQASTDQQRVDRAFANRGLKGGIKELFVTGKLNL